MAMKQLARRLQPLPLYFILGLTLCLFGPQIIIAHITHSLTLLLDAYHALCNIIVLVGTIISIKHGSGRSDHSSTTNSQEELKSLASLAHGNTQMCCATRPGPERHLRNTFGWARVDVVVMLIGCVFLASLCFSVLVEALQTLVHISHHDEMHQPVVVMVTGALSLVLNLLTYLLIGGYMFHKGSFLSEESGKGTVFGDTKPTAGDTKPTAGDTQTPDLSSRASKRQGLLGLCRDCTGSIIVMVCAMVVNSTESDIAKFVDPLLSIFAAIMVLILSYPFMKESCLILLQTIPDHINIGSLTGQLQTAFPDIVNVHELHVWRLTVDKTYCTAHIIFLNPQEYSRITDDITKFFLGQGITHVTVQPEFYKDVNKSELISASSDCLVQCTEDLCMERHCCASRSPSLESVRVDAHSHKHKGSAKYKGSKCGGKVCQSPSPVENGAGMSVEASDSDSKSQDLDSAVINTEPGERKVSFELPQPKVPNSEATKATEKDNTGDQNLVKDKCLDKMSEASDKVHSMSVKLPGDYVAAREVRRNSRETSDV